MSDDEKRGVGYGVGTSCGGYGDLVGAYTNAFGGYFYDFCPDDVFIQILCQLKGELVKVITEAEEEGIIIGRLVTIGRDFIAVSCDGTVAYIRLINIVAIIPAD